MKLTKVFLLITLISVYLSASIVGVTKGEFNVNMGVASYSLKIDTPPGVAGMDPKLSLNYSSTPKNGIMGVGWSIGGESTITRCSQNRVIDGKSFTPGIKFGTNGVKDRFCLDGKRLILVKGEYGKDGSEYRKRINDYSKIIAHTSNENHGIEWFEVKTKDGLTYIYGKDDATILLNDKFFSNISNTRLFWKLKYIKDTFGNKITYHYNRNYKDIYLSSITYADNKIEGSRLV